MPKHQGNKRAHRPPPKHFLCFPLVTDESVRQLSDSLAYFRSVTTRLSEQDTDAIPEREGSNEPARPTAVAESSPVSQRPDPEMAKQLRILPTTAHRPPGTYHFTLGTMDLSSQEDMDKAVALLHEIDYLALLREAERSGAPGFGESRQGEGRRRVAGAKEGKRRVEAPEESTGSTVESGHGNLNASLDEGVAPETTHHSPNKANQNASPPASTPDITAEDPRSPPTAQTLKSLTRTISPPPTSSRSKVPQPINPNSSSPPAPLSITLHSLGVFPKPSSARVFYAHPIDPTRRLKVFSTLIRERFNAAGLILDRRPLVLHATVANMIYAKREAKTTAASSRIEGGHAVDARQILTFFNGDGHDGREGEPGLASAATEAKAQLPIPYIWATDIPITSIRICKMGAEPSEKPGWGLEYRAIAEKSFLPATDQES